MGSSVAFSAVTAESFNREVVRHDEDDVGFARRRGIGTQEAGSGEDQK
jgi:hypothetical protein